MAQEIIDFTKIDMTSEDRKYYAGIKRDDPTVVTIMNTVKNSQPRELINPITIQEKTNMIIAGFKRRKAWEILFNEQEVRKAVVIRRINCNDNMIPILRNIENFARKNINPWELAEIVDNTVVLLKEINPSIDKPGPTSKR